MVEFGYAWFPPFRCRSAVGGQPISVLVSSSLCIRKDVSSISVLTCNGNGTKERQRYTTARHNGTTERQNGNGETATAERQRNGGNHGISSLLGRVTAGKQVCQQPTRSTQVGHTSMCRHNELAPAKLGSKTHHAIHCSPWFDTVSCCLAVD